MEYFAIILCIASATSGLRPTNRVWKLPKPQYNAMIGQVCGSNFETFATYERFIQARARMKDLVLLHPGPCSRTCQMYNPACGNDGVTYHNICHLEYAKFKISGLKLAGVGFCQPRRDNMEYQQYDIDRDIAMDYYDDTLRNNEHTATRKYTKDLNMWNVYAFLRNM